ncbi:MAG: hypothetical protein AAF787_12180 [Chloroflexota bacterium]
MLARVLRLLPVPVLLLALAIVGVRYAARTMNAVPPLEIFEQCDGLCWRQIQPGVTSISDSIDLLQGAGITNLRPFSGEFIYSGLAIKTDNRSNQYDAFITTATPELLVDQITISQAVCSHVVLAALGKPAQILQPPHGDRTFVYVFYIKDEAVVIFRNQPGSSVLVGAGLLSASGYHHLHRLSLQDYTVVGWHTAENTLRQPCEPLP